MKTIKTDRVLVNFKNEPLKNGEEDLTVGIAIASILGGKVSNPTLGWVLGKKFATEKTVDLKAEDVVFIKKEIEANDLWTGLVKGQIIELLEEKEEDKAEKKK